MPVEKIKKYQIENFADLIVFINKDRIFSL